MSERREAGGEYLLEARDIVKMFGDFTANDRITLRLRRGQIHALLGENGAGKSTLVKIMYGALQPTAGHLRWRGQDMVVPNPAAARRLGIAMVFQHFSLFDALTVVENIALALRGAFDPNSLGERVARVSREYGLPLEPSALVADLSVGERQRIEIVRCLLQEPQLLIMDEPTAVLTPQEADQLFITLRRLAADGCAVLYISHRLERSEAAVPRRHHPAPRQGGGRGRPAGRNRRLAGTADGRGGRARGERRRPPQRRNAAADGRRPVAAGRRAVRGGAAQYLPGGARR